MGLGLGLGLTSTVTLTLLRKPPRRRRTIERREAQAETAGGGVDRMTHPSSERCRYSRAFPLDALEVLPLADWCRCGLRVASVAAGSAAGTASPLQTLSAPIAPVRPPSRDAPARKPPLAPDGPTAAATELDEPLPVLRAAPSSPRLARSSSSARLSAPRCAGRRTVVLDCDGGVLVVVAEASPVAMSLHLTEGSSNSSIR